MDNCTRSVFMTKLLQHALEYIYRQKIDIK